MDRRAFLSGGLMLITAPAIVRAASLMPVRGLIMESGLSVRCQSYPIVPYSVPLDIGSDVLEWIVITFRWDEHGGIVTERQVRNSVSLRR